jgi:hypothetical protein
MRTRFGGAQLEESGGKPRALQTLREGWGRWRIGGQWAGEADPHQQRPVISHDFPTEIFAGEAAGRTAGRDLVSFLKRMQDEK